jgi:hypothetical protein
MSHSKDETSEVSIEGTTSPLSERVDLSWTLRYKESLFYVSFKGRDKRGEY